MKSIFILFAFLFCSPIFIYSQLPTYAGLPDSSHVLVVYKVPDGPLDTLGLISRDVKDYYQLQRGIPEINIVPLTDLPDREPFTYNGEEHIIKIVQSGDIIQDSTQAEIDMADPLHYLSSFHAWQYFYQHIAEPIKNYLISHNLTTTIRYIVLCKGVPYKIQAMGDYGGLPPVPPNKNVSLQSLLSILNNEPYLTTLETLFFSYIDRTNPYYMNDIDDYYYLDYRFLPDFYTYPGGLKLSYLVTRLDGLGFENVTQMIYNAVNADTSGLRTWVLDATQTGFGASYAAADLLNVLDFEVYYDNTSEFIINNQLFNNNEVICYQSGGHNSNMPEGYIQNLLTFTYAPGAVFDTYESFNGNSFGEIKRRAEHGLLTEFILKGGTGGVCYPWEPGGYNNNLVGGNIFFPAYSLGYNLVDAIYMNMPDLLYENTIAGDPLTRIYKIYPTKIIAADTTIISGDIDGIKIVVPQGRTLTIASGSVVNFKRNAQLVVDGNIIIEPNAEVHFKGVSRMFINDAVFDNSVVLDFSDYSNLLVNGELTLNDNFVLNLFDNSKMKLTETGNINYSAGVVLNAYDKSEVSLNDITFNNSFIFNFYSNTFLIAKDVLVEESSNINFNDASTFSAENLTIQGNSNVNLVAGTKLDVSGSLTLLENSSVTSIDGLNCGNLIFNSGSEINFYGNINRIVSNGLNILGSEINPININFNQTGTISYVGFNNANILHCNFNQGNLHIIPNGTNIIDNVQVQNCTFNNSSVSLSLKSINDLNISSCNFNNCSQPINIQNSDYIGNVVLTDLIINTFTQTWAVNIKNVNSVNLGNCSITNGNIGISIRDAIEAVVSNSNLNQVQTGISIGEVPRPPRESLLGQISINDNIISANFNGILFNQTNYSTINIKGNEITVPNPNLSCCININYSFWFGAQNTYIKGNSISGGEIGMQFTNGRNLTVYHNQVENSQDGIIFSNVDNIECIENSITNTQPIKYSGIFLGSSSGNIRDNEISGYMAGIWLANSSPYLATNTIYNNLYNGIYIGEGSSPYMNQYFHQESGCENLAYPFSGFNNIYENGGYTNYPDDDGSEIYFFHSNAFMDYGCNIIADNRAPNPPNLYTTQVLMNGSIFSGGIPVLNARGNYWGNNPLYGGNDPRNRFGDLTVNFYPYLTDPCTPALGGSCAWIISDMGGNVIDTLYPIQSSGDGSELDNLYAQGDTYFYNSQLNDARTVYNEITLNYGTDIQSINAYKKLLSIAVIQEQSPEELDALRTLYLQKSTETSDSTFIYMLQQLARLTLVAKKELGNVIEQFDEIVQQFPGTEKALYAEIDAYTTALLLDGNGMNKSSKYSLESSNAFGNKIKKLLKSYVDGEYQTNSNVIPKDYNLYQNYPNPFNPVTTIKYDLANAGDASVIIYDILGRKVKTLVNETKEAGRYEIQFDASKLASGVYIYQLKANGFITSKKMLLLK